MTKTLANHVWAVVLSGGKGERMQAFIQRWLGEARPKQYCAFVGKRTMLEHAVDRAAKIVPPSQLLTLIGPGHGVYLGDEKQSGRYGTVLEQPADRGTAAGVLLPLAHILDSDPEAIVLVLPSDHYIYPESRFVRLLRRAVRLVEERPSNLVTLAARATRPETEYGWIRVKPPAERDAGPLEVDAFEEKPRKRDADHYFAGGCLWNTMVMAVRAQTLWQLAATCTPDVVAGLEEYRRLRRLCADSPMRPMHELVALHQTYQTLPSADFSRDIEQQVVDRIVALPMSGIQWCDWGRPARIQDTLTEIGLRGAFPDEAWTGFGSGAQPLCLPGAHATG
jgi:mannose-1-phosphate guanylyltransferase